MTDLKKIIFIALTLVLFSCNDDKGSGETTRVDTSMIEFSPLDSDHYIISGDNDTHKYKNAPTDLYLRKGNESVEEMKKKGAQIGTWPSIGNDTLPKLQFYDLSKVSSERLYLSRSTFSLIETNDSIRGREYITMFLDKDSVIQIKGDTMRLLKIAMKMYLYYMQQQHKPVILISPNKSDTFRLHPGDTVRLVSVGGNVEYAKK